MNKTNKFNRMKKYNKMNKMNRVNKMNKPNKISKFKKRSKPQTKNYVKRDVCTVKTHRIFVFNAKSLTS